MSAQGLYWNTLLSVPRPPYVGDPDFGNVFLLMDGSASVTTDSSLNNYTLVTGGQIASTLSSEQTLFGRNTYKAASGGALSTDVTYIVAPNDIFGSNLGANNFTIEGWYWIRFPFATTNNSNSIRFFNVGNITFQAFNTAASPGTLFCYFTNIGFSSYSVGTPSNSLPIEEWFHLALVRQNNGPNSTVKLYINGNYISQTPNFSASDSYIGQNQTFPTGQKVLHADFNTSPSRPFYMGSLRCTKNIARYTSNFVPPTEPFPNT